MKRLHHYLFFLFTCSLLACTDNGDGRILVTTGDISPDEAVINNDYQVVSVAGSVQIQGNLPDGYKIESAGVIYGVDSTELKIASCQRYDGVGQYSNYYSCFQTICYQTSGRSTAINIEIEDTTFKEDGSIYCFGYREIYGGERSFTCPLINLPRGTNIYLRAFAHISKGNNDNRYVYGHIKQFLTAGIHQDPSVFIELDALGIAISKMDVEVSQGLDAQRYCSNVNFYETLGGYTDWRVPTLHELEEIYKLRRSIGGFSEAKYFSCELLQGSDYMYWYWDFVTNMAGHETSDGYGRLHGRLRLVRDL